jgi:hypothetical protein
MAQVFIIHADEDKDFAKDLADRLARAGIEVWFPADQILPGDNWAKKMGAALDRSNALVVVVSPASAESRWVRQTISYALGTPRYRDRVIPVVVKPTKGMPWFLGQLKPMRASKDRSRLSRQIVRKLQTA